MSEKTNSFKRVEPDKLKEGETPTNPGVNVDDHVYFHHPKLGPHSGRVLAHGIHGCTVEDASKKRHKVEWSRVLGLKSRAVYPLKVVDHGVGGAILEHPDGRRVFAAGELPIPAPAEPLNLDKLLAKERMTKSEPVAELESLLAGLRDPKPMLKSHAASVPLLFRRSAS